MNISKIEEKKGVYIVTREPSFIERFFGVKKRVDKYKNTGHHYTFGGGSIYVDQEGRELGNSLGYGSSTREAIDCWRRSF